MKRILLFAVLFSAFQSATAQGILDRVKNRAKAKVNQKVDEKIDKAVSKPIDEADDAMSGKNKDKKKSGDKETNKDGNAGDNNPSKGDPPATLKSYSKFDFVPGEKIVASEDFSQDNIGDFPDKWNTNGSGEIVTVSNTPGKFLMTQKEVIFYPEWISNLPDNFTLEFDLMCSQQFSYYSGWLIVGATTATNVGKDFGKFARFGQGRVDNGGGFEVAFHPENAGGKQGMTTFYSSLSGQQVMKNDNDQDKFMVPEKNMAHISIWRQKGRVRVYMDDKKVWDLPRGASENLKLNSIYFRNDGNNSNDDAFYVGNVRLAVGAPDTRNKLITEGKFVTHGILFDVNSDNIRPESYGALKDIATVLNENADVKVKIVGHTDADGDDKSNLELSKRRAEAVKTVLSKEFTIADSRMTTEGKGESQPIDNKTTTAAKANNRRVEFIKQ